MSTPKITASRLMKLVIRENEIGGMNTWFGLDGDNMPSAITLVGGAIELQCTRESQFFASDGELMCSTYTNPGLEYKITIFKDKA
jgi:hypothetical protein